MKPLKIKNLKTSKTEKQLQDEIAAIKSKKYFQLASTDWTRLDDVPLQNREDFKTWREEIRNLKISSLSDQIKLDSIIKKKPVPVFSSEKPEEFDKTIKLSQELSTNDAYVESVSRVTNDTVEKVLEDTRVGAKEFLMKLLIEEKQKELGKADSASYALFRLLQEEVIDYDPKNKPPKFLEKYMNAIGLDPSDQDSLDEVKRICKEYFSRINEIFFKFEQKLRSVYNMSDQELLMELNDRGYRYRLTD